RCARRLQRHDLRTGRRCLAWRQRGVHAHLPSDGAALTTYPDYQIQKSPPWLQGPNGATWSFVSGITKEAYLEAAKRAVKARFPQFAPSDALDKVGENFQIDRAFAGSDSVFVAQLMNAWATWGA